MRGKQHCDWGEHWFVEAFGHAVSGNEWICVKYGRKPYHRRVTRAIGEKVAWKRVGCWHRVKDKDCICECHERSLP